jgi:hypothetical protein
VETRISRNSRIEKPKANKSWVCKPIKEPKSYTFLSPMLENVLKAKQNGIKVIKAPTKMPKNIAKEHKPSKQSVIDKHRSRMSK